MRLGEIITQNQTGIFFEGDSSRFALRPEPRPVACHRYGALRSGARHTPAPLLSGFTTSLNGNGLHNAQAVSVHQKIDCP